MTLKKTTVAAFDFDGTITTRDTLFDFIAFYHGKVKLLIGLFILSPVLILYVLRIVKNSTAKQKMFSYFFKGKRIDDFDKVCKSYSKRISEICNSEILDKMKWHKEQGHEIVIVSASIVNWIKPWASDLGIENVLGTEISVSNDCIQGTFATANCYEQEKVNRLLSRFPDRDKYTLYAYGDSNGDKELLALADYPTWVK